MASNLLIVESPSKAKTLKKYLGKDFEVLASYGHVRDLVPKTGAVDPDKNFAMQYELIERNARHVDAIAKAVKLADHVYLATDPDREGEAIAWHLAEILKSKRLLKDKTIQRVVFHEITQSAVKDAVAHPRDILIDLVDAQVARRALDYLVGFNLSPLLWKKIRRGLSAGRVQSPALRLIVERELEIRKFESREYWSLHLDTEASEQPFSARLVQLDGVKLDQFAVPNEERAQQVIDHLLQADSARVAQIERKQKSRYPAAPFTTSTLQQEAVRKLGLTTDRTMRTAQQLYEGMDLGSGTVGLITYMRTDSVALAREALDEIRGYIGQQYDPPYLPGAPVVYENKAKNAQEAHEAIRPTSILRTPESVAAYLNPEQARLYEMIWKRTVASQMSPARFDTVAVDLQVHGAGNRFRATGQTLVFPGFIAVYREDQDDVEQESDARLPPLEQGQTLPVLRIHGEQHFTQPPPRYTEASLVKALEEFGIGRPSTYASIIATLKDREYVVVDKKRFVPTDVGEVVNKFLTDHFGTYVDYHFTAQLEDQLDAISNGTAKWIPVLRSFWTDFSRQVEEKQNLKREDVAQEKLDEPCPKCGGVLTARLGKRGRFVGCTNFPTCDYTRNMDGSVPTPSSEAKVLGTDPVSQQAIQLLQGPYGFYIQVGEEPEPGKKKPKRVSVPREMNPLELSYDQALQLLSLPRTLGDHPETGKPVLANIGRFGPYVGHDGTFKSIPKNDSVFSIELDAALLLLAQAKAAKTPLRVIGPHPDDGKDVAVFAGRYGPYVAHGKINATVPKSENPDTVSLEVALALLAAKAGKAPGGKASSTKAAATKAAAPKTSATKAAGAKTTATKSPRKPKASTS